MKTNQELLKTISQYRELVGALIIKGNYTHEQEIALYYLISQDEIERAIEIANK